MSPETLTVDQVAALLRTSRRPVFDSIKSGDLPVARDGRRFLIASNDLAAFIARHSDQEIPPMLDTDNPLRLYDLDEVAKITKISLRTLQDMARARRITCVRIGQSPRLTMAQIEALIESYTDDPGKRERDALAATRDRVVRQRGRKATKPERAA